MVICSSVIEHWWLKPSLIIQAHGGRGEQEPRYAQAKIQFLSKLQAVVKKLKMNNWQLLKIKHKAELLVL